MDWSIVGFIAVNFLAAASGGIFRPGEWYERLTFPSWRPPNWLFPPVWTLIFMLIAYAGWRVWNTGGPGLGLAMTLYGVQLVLNSFWSALFFGARRMDLALIDVVALWLAIAGTVIAFWQIDALAGALMLPYLAWVSFAGVLNREMVRLNPDNGRAVAEQMK